MTSYRCCVECRELCYGTRCDPCARPYRVVLEHVLAGRHAEALAAQHASRDTRDKYAQEAQVAYVGGWRVVRGVMRPTHGRTAA